MELSELMRRVGLPTSVVEGGMPAHSCALRGLSCDSRRIQAGFLFVACAGSRAHGAWRNVYRGRFSSWGFGCYVEQGRRGRSTIWAWWSCESIILAVTML